jgi:hypothetical protein
VSPFARNDRRAAENSSVTAQGAGTKLLTETGFWESLGTATPYPGRRREVRSRRRPGLAALGDLTIVPLVAEIGKVVLDIRQQLPISAAGA